MTNQLQKNIIATITYFDVNDYPLTAFEIWKHLIKANSSVKDEDEQESWTLTKVMFALESEIVKEYVGEKNGFYFLQGRGELIKMRNKREMVSVHKIKKLRQKVFLLKYVPFVRMICLTGRLSQKNGTDKSDIDVFIVLKDGYIWTGRFLMTAVTQLFGWRRYGKKQKNRICLNYYVTDESLKVPTQDLFASQEYSFSLPIFDSEKVFDEFQKINSVWMREYKPNYNFSKFESELTVYDSGFSFWLRLIIEQFFAFKFVEDQMRKFQKKKILSNPKTKKMGALIIANDKHLVFLPEPHGPKVFSEYKRRFEALELE